MFAPIIASWIASLEPLPLPLLNRLQPRNNYLLHYREHKAFKVSYEHLMIVQSLSEFRNDGNPSSAMKQRGSAYFMNNIVIWVLFQNCIQHQALWRRGNRKRSKDKVSWYLFDDFQWCARRRGHYSKLVCKARSNWVFFIERLRQNIEQSIKNSRVDCSNKEPTIVAMRHCQNLALSLRLVQLKDRQVALTEIACQPPLYKVCSLLWQRSHTVQYCPILSKRWTNRWLESMVSLFHLRRKLGSQMHQSHCCHSDCRRCDLHTKFALHPQFFALVVRLLDNW